MNREYIAKGTAAWGSGTTRALAVKAMKRKWGVKPPKDGNFEVYSCPRGATVKDGVIDYPAMVDGTPAAPPMLVSRGTTSRWAFE